MATTDMEQVIKQALKPVLEGLAAARGALREMKTDLAKLSLDYYGVRRELDELNDKVGTVIVDTSDIKDEVKALGDEIVENRKTRKEVKEIKEHLGLAS